MTSANILIGKGQYIDGQWQNAPGAILESFNPSYGSLFWQGLMASNDAIEQAYLSARNALAQWTNSGFDARADCVKEFAVLIEKNRDQLALLISMEMGKPLWEAQLEVGAVINKVALSIQAYQERTWPKQSHTAEAEACLRFKPQGVAVVLGAFNFPAHLSSGHIIPALLAGNTILYKPSEQTPAVAEYLMQCWHDSGLPAGVINCLQGDETVAIPLLNKPIQAVYFTGSYATGRLIHQQFSGRPEVILALEMGGNNPLVLDKVENIKAAIYHTLLSTLITSGQRCTCARRLIIPNSQQGNEFIERLIAACSSVRIGAFDAEPTPFMGPVISHAQALKHLKTQENLLQMGGKTLLSMSLLEAFTGLLSPGIMDMTAVKNPPDQEIFAPFIQIYRYDTFNEAIALANATRYGLAAGLLSDDKAQYQTFYQSVYAGLINWNRPTTGAASSLPFGGVGLSGNHRPSAYFAADYCAYPVASMEQPLLQLPDTPLPGIVLE